MRRKSKMKKVNRVPKLKFDKKGLIPAIVQDAKTKKVLMVAYMNRKSLKITLAEGRTCFYSRSRKVLWRKGETSGHIQKVKGIYYSPEMVVDHIDTEDPDETFVALVWFSVHQALQNELLSLHLLEKVEARHG